MNQAPAALHSPHAPVEAARCRLHRLGELSRGAAPREGDSRLAEPRLETEGKALRQEVADALAAAREQLRTRRGGRLPTESDGLSGSLMGRCPVGFGSPRPDVTRRPGPTARTAHQGASTSWSR
jgi:hypothetical protein